LKDDVRPPRRGTSTTRWRASPTVVVVNYSSSRGGADHVVAEITADGGRAIAVQGDMSKIEDVRRLFWRRR